MKLFLLIVLLAVCSISFGQSKAKVVELDREVQAYQMKLVKEGLDPAIIEFSVDTFRVELKRRFSTPIGETDFDMSQEDYAVAKTYDSLLNKYYKKLADVLKGDDRNRLIAAQKAWISFRDNELTLISTISKPGYSGGGTAQRLVESSLYLDIIKNRLVDLHEHFLRATQTF